MRTVVLAAMLAGAPIAAAASSVDCGTATSAVEKVVCGDAPLAALDVELARLDRRRRRNGFDLDERDDRAAGRPAGREVVHRVQGERTPLNVL